MSNFGVLVLVLGDTHIPHRATQIPPQLQRMLVPGKMQHVIGTGNVDPTVVAGLSPNLHLVAGDWDNMTEYNHPQNQQQQQHIGQGENNNNNNNANARQASPLPETLVITVGAFRIGVIHGHQLLPWKNNKAAVERLQRKLQVDIVITGHTHVASVQEEENYYHINPGSITGALVPHGRPDQTIIPSFILLAVQDTKIVCYVYELVNGEVDVSKTELVKKIVSSASSLSGSVATPALLDNLLK